MFHLSAIVYTSQTGFTRRYAEMLAQKTGLPACELGGPAPARGTSVLYLGWLRAGGVQGLAKARRRWDVKGVCAVGMSPEPNGKVLGDPVLPAFYLRGGYAPERLTGLYRPMMSLMSRMVSKASAEDEGARAMQEAFAKGGDWVSAEQLSPVLDALTE